MVLLRNDIAKHMMYFADTAKMLSSYSVELKWFEEIYNGGNETEAMLRKFINRRIKLNFQRKNIILNTPNDAWLSFIDERQNPRSDKSFFKYIIDHTFYRPRDLILLFKDLGTLKYNIPLGRDSIQKLLNSYSVEMVKEIKNELSFNYRKPAIDSIFSILKMHGDRKPFSYATLFHELSTLGFRGDEDNLIATLFDYSLIGNKSTNREISFKCREKGADVSELDKDIPIILHYLLQTYYKTTTKI